MTKKSLFYLLNVLLLAAMVMSACQPTPTPTAPPEEPKPAETQAPAAPTTAPEQPQATEAQPVQPEATEAMQPTEAAVGGACQVPAAYTDPAKKPVVALVRKVGEGGFMERYLAGAQSMADELGIELVETNAHHRRPRPTRYGHPTHPGSPGCRHQGADLRHSGRAP
jgi:hypothetical protein